MSSGNLSHTSKWDRVAWFLWVEIFEETIELLFLISLATVKYNYYHFQQAHSGLQKPKMMHSATIVSLEVDTHKKPTYPNLPSVWKCGWKKNVKTKIFFFNFSHKDKQVSYGNLLKAFNTHITSSPDQTWLRGLFLKFSCPPNIHTLFGGKRNLTFGLLSQV